MNRFPKSAFLNIQAASRFLPGNQLFVAAIVCMLLIHACRLFTCEKSIFYLWTFGFRRGNERTLFGLVLLA